MNLSLEKLLKVRRPEQPLLMLMVGTIGLFQFCQIVNENFAETVFLKRYGGVRYLPATFFFNSLVFLLILTVLNRVVDRTARTRLVSNLLLVFAGLLLCLRLLVLMRAPLAYPVIYIVVKQMKYVFFIVFWTLATDIYSTRKARRIFPIIGGGAVMGTIVGSFLSRRIAALTGTDNLVLFSSVGMIVSYALVGLGRRQVSRLSPISFAPAESVTMASLGKFLKRELSQFRGSSLLGYLMLLAFLPGVVEPMFDYIFNYLANETYGSEASLLGFFGVFKGSFNMLIFACQIVLAGGIFRRFGIVNALFSYPIGYLLAFGGLYFGFRMPSAIIGGGALEVIDAAFYKPGSQMLYNIIPVGLRGRVTALVQGAIRRFGELAGSGLLVLLRAFVSPLNLNLVGPFFALLWAFYNYRLRRSYSTILYRSLSEKHVNFAELERRDLRSLMTAETADLLARNLASNKAATALMAARLLSQSGTGGWPEMVCAESIRREPALQIEMLRIVGTGRPPEAVPALLGVCDKIHESARAELALLVRRMAPERGVELFRRYLKSDNHRLVAESMLGLAATGDRIDVNRAVAKLDSERPEEVCSALYILGGIGDRSRLDRVLTFARASDPAVRAECALALGKLGLDISSDHWPALLADGDTRVRLKAVKGLSALREPGAVSLVIPLLGDEDGAVREAARALIDSHGEAAIPSLTRALPAAGFFARRALIGILDNLGVKEQTLLAFIDAKVRDGYRAVVRMRAAEGIPLHRSGEALSLLLRNRLSEATDDVYRTLAALLKGNRVQFILDSSHDREEAVREQALEALENVLTTDLARRLMPLLEDLPLDLKLAAGSKFYRLDGIDACGIFEEMLDSGSPPDTLCGLMCIVEARERGRPPISPALGDRAAREIEKRNLQGGTPVEDLMEKVLTLKDVPIFSYLQFKELLAIASISNAEIFHAGDTIVKQGERGYTMYIITSGSVRIVKEEVPLAELGVNDYFGEMALFDDSPRSATAIAEGDVRVLAIHKREFRDMLREYPGVAIMMCEEFCRRLRGAIEKVGG
jgi:HEAT repeat protein